MQNAKKEYFKNVTVWFLSTNTCIMYMIPTLGSAASAEMLSLGKCLNRFYGFGFLLVIDRKQVIKSGDLA